MRSVRADQTARARVTATGETLHWSVLTPSSVHCTKSYETRMTR